MDDETSAPRTYSVAQAESRLESLVRHVSRTRERIGITEEGRVAAVLISAQELADLEQALAVAEYRAQFVGVPTEQIKISEALGREGEKG